MTKLDHLFTKDGSSTLRNTDLNSTFHSVHGAIQESQHVFITEGFLKMVSSKENIHIFELGLGTGLNALLTALSATQNNTMIYYDCIEQFPLIESLWSELNYPTLLSGILPKEYFYKLHSSQWNQVQIIHDQFNLFKYQANWIDFQISLDHYDLFYMDAFGPEVQPELWNLDSLTKIWNSLRCNGVMVSYCAKGQFKRNLKSLGFIVEGIPGPPGKREMTRAIKPA